MRGRFYLLKLSLSMFGIVRVAYVLASVGSEGYLLYG
jgi:hypothetical protein